MTGYRLVLWRETSTMRFFTLVRVRTTPVGPYESRRRGGAGSPKR